MQLKSKWQPFQWGSFDQYSGKPNSGERYGIEQSIASSSSAGNSGADESPTIAATTHLIRGIYGAEKYSFIIVWIGRKQG